MESPHITAIPVDKEAVNYSTLADQAFSNGSITKHQALHVLMARPPEILTVFEQANRVRHHFFGNQVLLCSILNLKSGNCGEDCAFCAQSSRYHTQAETFGLVSYDQVDTYSSRAKSWGSHVGLVTSGKNALRGKDLESVLETIQKISPRARIDASFGFLDEEQARALKSAGLSTYNHNLETNRSFFPKIITTHTYDDRLRTVRTARAAGLKVCCGGILGMGESLEDRVNLAFEIQALNVDVIPINFLNPIPGTPLGSRPSMQPMEALKAVAMFRLVNPEKDIKICGGRECCLGEFQPMIFFAGASGLLIGDYLTTKGRQAEDDLKMIKDLGFEIAYDA
jgi:biotin synthase